MTRSRLSGRIAATVVIAVAVTQVFVWFSGGVDSGITKTMRDLQPAASLAARSPSTASEPT